MNILCLGCSYTAGMPDDYYSWSEFLATERPSDNVYNLAIGGSSLLFSIYLLEQFKEELNPDVIIFQITHPYRFTGFDKLSLDYIQDNNYYRLSPHIRKEQKIFTVTPADVSPNWSLVEQKIEFAKKYYKFYNQGLGILEYNILKNYAGNESTISFTYDDVPKEAKENIIDSAGHFSILGHEIVGEWINGQLERNLHKNLS
jgi:hypothetical protein